MKQNYSFTRKDSVCSIETVKTFDSVRSFKRNPFCPRTMASSHPGVPSGDLATVGEVYSELQLINFLHFFHARL